MCRISCSFYPLFWLFGGIFYRVTKRIQSNYFYISYYFSLGVFKCRTDFYLFGNTFSIGIFNQYPFQELRKLSLIRTFFNLFVFLFYLPIGRILFSLKLLCI